MGTTEIVLLVIGGLFFVISFFLPDGKKKKEQKITEAEIKALIDKEMADAKTRIDDMVDETVNYSVEKTERALEKLSNEKIMAVDEYSEAVLNKIDKNHKEAVFLYDMLNDKDEKLKNSDAKIEEEKKAMAAKEEELKARSQMIEEQERVAKQLEEERTKAIEEAQAKALEEAKAKALEAEKADAFKPLNPEKVEVIGNMVAPTPEKAPAKKTQSRAKTSKTTAGKTAKTATEEAPKTFESFEGGRQNSNELIINLHKQGKSNMAIAKELGLGVGEVKLVIDLFVSKNK